MACKFRVYERVDVDSNEVKVIDFTCDDIRKNKEEWKRQWRERNHTDAVIKSGRSDWSYELYCKNIEECLSRCKCSQKIPLKCDKCTDEQHEGHFCRCEDRNIKLAKQLRDEGKSTWNK